MMNKHGVAVVLYRPTPAQVDHLVGLPRLGANVVAVDNSPEVDSALHETLADAGIHVVVNGNKGGLGGGLNRGVEALIGSGHELVTLLDQDSEFDDDFLERLAAAAASVDSDSFILGATIFETTTGEYLPVRPPVGQVRSPITSLGLMAADDVITSGSTFPVVTYRQLGPFREDLFIEAIDSEYALRAHRAGVGLYVVRGAVLRQIRGATVVRFGVPTSRLNTARRYYLARNATAVRREYGLGSGAAVRMVAREAAKVAILESGRLVKVTGYVVGLLDGFRGHLGPFEDRHPRLARAAAAFRA